MTSTGTASSAPRHPAVHDPAIGVLGDNFGIVQRAFGSITSGNAWPRGFASTRPDVNGCHTARVRRDVLAPRGTSAESLRGPKIGE